MTTSSRLRVWVTVVGAFADPCNKGILASGIFGVLLAFEGLYREFLGIKDE
jgi:hypothetical protein